MDTKLKNSHKLGVWLIILAVAAASAATIGLYPYMKAKAGEYSSDRMTRLMEQNYDYSGLATQVMNFSYEIWHQQKQEEEGRVLTYSQTFLPGLEEKIRRARAEEYGFTDDRGVTYSQAGSSTGTSDEVDGAGPGASGADGSEDGAGDVSAGNVSAGEYGVTAERLSSDVYDDSMDNTELRIVSDYNYYDSQYDLDYYQSLQTLMDTVGRDWERYFQKYNSALFYAVLDENNRYQRSNVSSPEQFFDSPLNEQAREFKFTVEFSGTGSLKVVDFAGGDEDASRLLQAMNRFEFYDPLTQRLSDDYRYSDVRFSGPKNIKIQFRCVPDTFNNAMRLADDWETDGRSYIDGGGYYTVVGSMMFILAVMALALPAVKKLEIGKSALCRLSFEPLSLIGMGWLCIMGEGSIPGTLMSATVTGTLKQELLRAEFLPWSADVMVVVINLVFWGIAYGLFYWGITCYRAVFSLGLWRYFKERTWLGRFLRFIKRWACNALNVFNETDWESRSTKIIGKAVIGNFVILTLISCLWFWGIGALVIYSIVLFILLRKYWGEMQVKYRTLLNGINEIAEGNLDVEIKEDLGIFNPFKEQLCRIQEGLKKAVAQEVKSERTKSELITNVSHDLKTPLTAIITYVNLLKQENVTEEERRSYIQVLDQKSMRLKVLIEDLFEVSKASSGTVTLHPENVDIISLLKQVRFELSDKMEASGIEFRFNLPEERVVLYLDSQKTYRIFENLLVNIAKYGLPGTRAYILVAREPDGYVNISMRNISAKELNVSPEELTERFVRGDSSRNTEGSGLGLAIARSFVEVQGGTMKIEVEDDLFRVIIRWKEAMVQRDKEPDKGQEKDSEGEPERGPEQGPEGGMEQNPDQYPNLDNRGGGAPVSGEDGRITDREASDDIEVISGEWTVVQDEESRDAR
ncbi:sensor histidine kinase [Clostridium sp. FS41]|uniref:sensor histidine kinase n=2 Tax=Clostridia TaxID=186801 RepID=UPI0005D3DAA2|nr:sensor histidine kinase [Clostridium sp. FS41]KJJ73370.1 alkaline phosphatase synthesis sensor protein PhoR [Clostridium sp. FS41]